MQYGQDYKPKYRVGQGVTVAAGTRNERYVIIADRVVYRSKAHPRGDTFYRFADDTGAWEWNLSPVSERISPETAAMRIIDSFQARVIGSRVEVTRDDDIGAWEVSIGLDVYHNPIGDAAPYVVSLTFFATADNARLVDACGDWTAQLGTEVFHSDNLGDIIAQTYNANLAAKV